MLNFYWYLRLE